MTDNNVTTINTVEGKPSLFIYETLSGIIFHCLPISLPTLRAIQMKASDKFPYPNPEPYRILDPEDVSFTPGQASKADENPLYIADCQAVDNERKHWSDRAVFDYAVKCPKYPTKADMVAAYKEQLDKLKEIATFDKEMDDYEIVLFHIVLSWNQPAKNAKGNLVAVSNEYGRILELIMQTVALSPAEVQAGVRFFRPKI